MDKKLTFVGNFKININIKVMDIYKITKGQLVTMYIFSIALWFASIIVANENDSFFLVFLIIFLPSALTFYTIGWKKFK